MRIRQIIAKKLAIILMLRRRRIRKGCFRQYYVRTVHANDNQQRFRIFWRYYHSIDASDLKGFCNFSPKQFDDLFEKIRRFMPAHKKNSQVAD